MSDSSLNRDPVEELAEEFVERYRRGERPTPAEYTAKYPQYAEAIAKLFPALLLMEQLKPAATEATGPFHPKNDLVKGQTLERLGDFRILRPVGQGGMGVVYEAEHVTLGRRVALKVLPLQAAKDGNSLERFRHEVKAAAKLHHSNIVPVFEVGQDGDYCFYSMQFIHGQPLDQVLDEVRRLQATTAIPPPGSDHRVAQSLLSGLPAVYSPAKLEASPSSGVKLPGAAASSSRGSNRRPYHRSVAHVGVQVAQALAYAHQEGVIHRDIKPSNLLLDTESRVWITDFGLAKTDGAALTRPGDIVGTVRYMAPERFQGWSDPRSDIYSLGITLYEMLLLRPAFVAADRMKLIHQVTHDEPPRPRKVAPTIPRDLETIVLKAIAKEPSQRYQTARELAEDLQRFVEDRPIRARRISGTERTWRWCRRNPMVASLIAAVIVVTLAGFAATIAQMTKANAKAREATQQRNEARAANTELLAAQGQLRRTLYAAHMNLVQAAWDADNVGRVLELLASQVPQPGEPDLRGFEWHYWNRLCHSDLRTVKLQEYQRDSGASLSSDGKRLAAFVAFKGTVSDDRVKVWDTATGRVLTEIVLAVGSSTQIRAELSPDGARVATVRREENAPTKSDEIKVWDASTGKDLLTILAPRGDLVWGSKFSSDGTRLAKIIGKTELKVWSAATGEEIASIVAHLRPIENPRSSLYDGSRLELPLLFSPDGTRIIAHSGQRTRAHVWEVATGKELFRMEGEIVAFSPDGQRIISIPAKQSVRISQASNGKDIFTFPVPDGAGWKWRVSPDGKFFAGVPALGNNIRVWDAATGKLELTLKGHASAVRALAFNSDGRQIISAANDGTVKVWNATIPGEKPPFDPQAFRDTSWLFRASTADGRRWAHVGKGSAPPGVAIKVSDDTGKELSSFELGLGQFRGMVFSPDGSHLAAIWRPRPQRAHPQRDELKVWAIQANREVLSVPGPYDGFRGYQPGFLFSPDSKRLAILSEAPKWDGITPLRQQGFRMFDLVAGKEILTVQDQRRYYYRLTFSADGARLATAFRGRDPDTDYYMNSGGVQVWDAFRGQSLSTLEGGAGYGCVTFSPDNTLIAAGTGNFIDQDSGEVHVWHVKPESAEWASAPAFVLHGHSRGWISSVAFSPDAKRVVSATNPRGHPPGLEVKVWDAQTFQELITLESQNAFLSPHVEFSRDGRQLLAIETVQGRRQILHTWDATPLPKQP